MKEICLDSGSPKYPFLEYSSKHLTPARKTSSNTCRLYGIKDASVTCGNVGSQGAFLAELITVPGFHEMSYQLSFVNKEWHDLCHSLWMAPEAGIAQ